MGGSFVLGAHLARGELLIAIQQRNDNLPRARLHLMTTAILGPVRLEPIVQAKITYLGGAMHKHARPKKGVKFAGEQISASGRTSTRQVPKIRILRGRDRIHLGGRMQKEFVQALTPRIRALARANVRKPAQVADSLNRAGVLTAACERWTPRSVWWLLYVVYSQPRTRGPRP